MNELSTEYFEHKLDELDNDDKALSQYLNEINYKSFGKYFYELMEAKKLSVKDIYIKCTNISESYIYAIRNDEKSPTRDVVITVACAMGITVEETNTLLKYAGHRKLYAKDKDDALIIYCLNKKMDTSSIEELLRSKNSHYRLFRDE